MTLIKYSRREPTACHDSHYLVWMNIYVILLSALQKTLNWNQTRFWQQTPTYLTHHCSSVGCVMAHWRGTRRFFARLRLLFLFTPPFFSELLSTRQHETSPYCRVRPTSRPIKNFDFTTECLWGSSTSSLGVYSLCIVGDHHHGSPKDDMTCSTGICYTTETTLEWPFQTQLRYIFMNTVLILPSDQELS